MVLVGIGTGSASLLPPISLPAFLDVLLCRIDDTEADIATLSKKMSVAHKSP